jgi:hypothetical protein
MLAARSDRDFVTTESPRARTLRHSGARPGAPRAAKPRAATGAKAERSSAVRAAGWLLLRGLALAARHPVEIAIALALGGGGGMIAWNALAVQNSRHPAPLFGEFKPDKPVAKAVPLRPSPDAAVTAPRPVTREVPARDAIGDLIRQGEPQRAVKPIEAARPVDPPPRPAPSPPPKPPHASRDPIGDLIRGDGKPAAPTTPAAAAPASTLPAPASAPAPADPLADLLRGENPVPPGFVGHAESSALVAAGQRALVKLGFGPLKTDGLMGPSTRQAIERFERERKLPVTGEFGPRTARELAAQAKLPVE